MKLSWSHKLFLVVNQWAGTSRVYDALVKFWAEYALFLFAFAVVASILWQNPHTGAVIFVFVWLPLMWAAGMGISWLIGWAYPHRRPAIEFPHTRQLITPLSNWKSLPSDHAFSAWLLVFAAVFGLHGSIATGLMAVFAACAVLISAARVLAGVHYPRDVVAGTVLAGVVAWAFFG